MKTKIEMWAALYVQTSETSDGKPKILKVCSTKEEAENEVYMDMVQWERNFGDDYKMNYVDKSAEKSDDPTSTCEWSVGRFEIEVSVNPA